MKKFAVLLVVLILAAGGFLAYRCHLAAERLRAIASGGQYHALGLRLTVSPPAGGVKGLFRLQPYLDIPQVSLDASRWGASLLPLQLGPGRLKTGLWNTVGLRLVLRAGSSADGEIEFDRLAFELGWPDRVLSLSAKSLRILDKAPSTGESLTFHKPWLQLRPGKDEIPSQLNLRMESVTWKKSSPGLAAERLQIGLTELGYALGSEGADWKWRTHFRSQGVAMAGGKTQGEVRPWNFTSEGRSVAWDAAAREKWKALWKSLPPELEGKIPALMAAIGQLRSRIDKLDFGWGGFDLYQGKAWRAELEPVDFAVQYLAEQGGYAWKLNGHAKSLVLTGSDRHLMVQDLAFAESLAYRGLSYEAWLDLALRSYAELAASREPGAGMTDPASFFLPYLAHLPDRLEGEFKIGRLGWTAPGYRSEHRDLRFDFGMKDEGLTCRMSGAFDSQAESGFPPPVKNGKIDFDFSFPLPYLDLIRLARSEAESRSSAGLAALGGRDAGLDWKWRVDLGAAAFALEMDLSAIAKLDLFVAATALVGVTTLSGDTVANLPRLFIETGKLRFHLKIDRLSKLQAFLERLKSGSSLALGLAGAYVVVDSKADNLSLDLTLQEGQILLNGKKNDSLEALLKSQR